MPLKSGPCTYRSELFESPETQMRKSLLLVLIALCSGLSTLKAQGIGIYNSEHKLIHRYQQGSDIDFRIDYKKLYPERNDSILEARVYGVIDTINRKDIHLVENYVILHMTRDHYYLIEKEFEYTDLTIGADDIKAVNFTTTGQSIGTALIAVGLAAVVISPLFGLNPGGGFAGERMAIAAGMGAGCAVIGTGFYIAFGQKPVRIKNFNGPDYFKKYQGGSISLTE